MNSLKLAKEYLTRLQSSLTSIQHRMDASYTDKLDGKIAEDFWERKMNEWRGGGTAGQTGYRRPR